MADETTRLRWDFEVRGLNETLRDMENLQDVIEASHKELDRLGKARGGKALRDELQRAAHAADGLGSSLANSGSEYLGYMSQSAKMTRKLADQQVLAKARMERAARRLADAEESGDARAIKAAQERVKKQVQAYKKITAAGLAHARKQQQQVRQIAEATRDKAAHRQQVREGMSRAFAAARSGSFSDTREALRGAAGGMQGVGRGVSGLGGNIAKAGAARGGLVGRGMAGAGKGLATMGRAATAMAGAAASVAAVAAGLALVAKLAFDAWQETKKLNRSFVATQSITAFMPEDLTGTTEGIHAARLEMERLRRETTDVMRAYELGLGKDALPALISTLNETGITYRSVKDDVVGMLETSAVSAKMLGVDIGDTTQLMATLRDESGQSMDQMSDAFSKIIMDANSSGMATKRFFGIVQQMSGEMGLYNYRIEETSGLLKQLGKMMDAKSAEKFMQSLGSGVRQMDLSSRMRLAAVTGVGRTASVVRGSARRSLRNLGAENYSKLQAGLERIGVKGVQVDASNVEKVLRKLTAKQQRMLFATLDKGLAKQIEAPLKMLQKSGKGILDLADVMGDTGALDQVGMQIDLLQKAFGKNIQRIRGVEAQALGVDEERLRLMQRFDSRSRGQFELLQAAAKKGPEELGKVASRLGFKGIGMDSKGRLTRDGKVLKDSKDLLAAMSKEQKTRIANAAKTQRELAQEQVSATRELSTIMETGVSALLNGIWSTLTSIYSWLIKTLGKYAGVDPKTIAQMQRAEKGKELEAEVRKARVKLREAQKIGHKPGIEAASKELRYHQERLSTFQSLPAQKRAQEALERDMENARVARELAFGRSAAGKKAKVAQLLNQGDDQMLQDVADGKKAQENTEKLNAKALQLLERSGIRLSPQDMKKQAEEIVRAEIRERQFTQALQANGLGALAEKKLGGMMEMRRLFDVYSSGGKLTSDTFDKTELGRIQAGFQQAKVPKAGDARIVTRGIPLLDLKAGDVVVDSAMLARAVPGYAGQMVPSVAKAAAGGASQGAQVVNHNTFNISGGDPQTIRQIILKTLEEARLRAATSSK